MMKVWHITSDVGYGGHLLYNLTNKCKESSRTIAVDRPIYKLFIQRGSIIFYGRKL